MTWEKEKAYRAKRAQKLGEIMDTAIVNLDEHMFTTTYQTAMNYMKRKQLNDYMKRFIVACIANKKGVIE